MKTLRSYVCGEWTAGTGEMATLVNPATEEPLAVVPTCGVDSDACLRYARERGGPALREMTFAQRGKLLGALASAIHAHRDELIELSIANGGNTRGDAKFDVDGAAGTLGAYATLAETLGERRALPDGESVQLGRSPRFVGLHLRVPLQGAAVHINAFNFPAWGLAEKAAVALLAGMPVVSKAATSTALLAARIVEIAVEKDILPAGAFSFIAGGVGDLLQHLGPQDVLAFTGSSETAIRLRRLDNILRRSVRVNIEADSLNAAVLAPAPEEETYELFLREVVRDMTQKAGQKCTAIRRVFVPADDLSRVRADLVERLAEIKVGDPALAEVKMGPLCNDAQLRDVQEGIRRLREQSELAYGDGGRGTLLGVVGAKGYFVSPVLLQTSNAEAASAAHSHEVFGPVATLMPYAGEASDAARLVCLGDGGLVASIYTDNREFLSRFVAGAAHAHGRIHVGSAKIAEHSPGPGTVLPQLVHGGPGRAGGGEELGGARGLDFYTQRVAIQGYRPLLEDLKF